MSQPMDEWGRPADVGGEFVKPKDLRGHLLIVYPIGYVPFIATRFSGPDKKSDAIAVDVVDLDDKDEYGNPGKIYRNSNWMQSQLIVALRPEIGRRLLGRIDLGVSRNGMNPPWVLVDALDDPGAKERAQAWAHAHPNFHPTVFTPRDQQPVQMEATPYQNTNPAPRPEQYQQPVQQYVTEPQQQRPSTPAYPVSGSQPLSDDELSMLEMMRKRRAEAAGRQQQSDEAPF